MRMKRRSIFLALTILAIFAVPHKIEGRISLEHLPKVKTIQLKANFQKNTQASRPLAKEESNRLSPFAERVLIQARKKIPDRRRPNTPIELKQFEADLKAFEIRVREQKLDPKETKATLQQVSRLLESHGIIPNGVKSERNRIRLAEQILAKAAEPTSSDQGNNSTCNVTVIENRLYIREPHVAANFVTELALHGQYRATDGTLLRISPENLRPYRDSLENNHRGDGARTFAGQIFQTAAVNLLYAKLDSENDPDGKLEYKQGPNSARLIYHGDLSKLAPYIVKELGTDAPVRAAETYGMVRINKMLTGRDDSDSFLVHINYIGREDADFKGNFFSSPEWLNWIIEDLQARKQLPAILTIDASGSLLGGDIRDRAVASHVILITSYTPGKFGNFGRVTLDDQTGNCNDYGPEDDWYIEDLFYATEYKPAMETLEQISEAIEELEKAGEPPLTASEKKELATEIVTAYLTIFRETNILTPPQLEDEKLFLKILREPRKSRSAFI